MRFFAITCLTIVPLVAVAAESPEKVLQQHGLKQAGGLWHLSSDLRITERVQTAERMERRIYDLRKHIDTLLEHNERMRIQLATLNAAQKAARAARKTVKGDSPEQKLWDEQIKQQGAVIEQLRKSIVPGDKLGATMPLKSLVMELVGVRSEAAFHVLSARRHIQQAPVRDEALRKNAEVVAALTALEPPGELAPVRTYANEVRSLERLEKALFTDELPLFREGKQWRVTGIANEELPITFTFYESTEPTVITRTMADTLGLDLREKPKIEHKLGKENVKATTMRLERLRFGRHVLHDVEVLVLTPESENLGARIGLGAFRDLRLRVVPERLLLRLDPKAEPSKK